MKLGVTGSRFGMSAEQKATFWKLINLYKDDLTLFTHGDCLGADVEAAQIVRELCPTLTIHSRPGLDPKWRGFFPSTFEHPAKKYLPRDRDIVNTSTHMIATPLSMEDRTGGTWYTTNYSIEKNVPIIIIARNGTYEIKLGQKGLTFK